MHLTACAIGLIGQRVCTFVEMKGLEDMAGLAVLKTLAAFEFPNHKPIVLPKDHKKFGIDRLMHKNPKLKAELEKLHN